MAKIPKKVSRSAEKSAPLAAAPTEETFRAALAAHEDLKQYSDNARLLFALRIYFDIDDIHSVAANSLTDGPDDKKCDLIHVDKESRYAVLAQAYESRGRLAKKEAPASKASDLNTAVTWALGEPLTRLPTRIKDAARELREALDEGSIDKLHIWYVHNSKESQNVQSELKTVETTIKRIAQQHDWTSTIFEVLEVGDGRLAEWYNALQSPIRVSDSMDIPITGGYEISGPNWKAAVTSIPLHWLRSVYQKHKSELFSANIRAYLGFQNKEENINNGIRNSALNAPGNFWVYNNGITVLVHDFKFLGTEGNRKLHVEGLSVVNGAQTTGAIGNLEDHLDQAAMVPARFVKTGDSQTVQDIIRFNNSQNKINAADFRSNDRIQRKLRDEFQAQFPSITYRGGRRGGESDAISRHKKESLIPSDTAAQALAAFHQQPRLAYMHKGQIWEDNNVYGKFFSEQISARHLVFTFSLLRAVEKRKQEVKESKQSESSIGIEEDALKFFAGKGSTYLLVSAIAKCLDVFCQRRISNPFDVAFSSPVTLSRGVLLWAPIVDISVAFTFALVPAIAAKLRDRDVETALKSFQAQIYATRQYNENIYADFTKKVK